MRRVAGLVVLLLALSLPSPTTAAQPSAAVRGLVRAAATGQPVAGAAVTAWEGRLNAVSDSSGAFGWDAIPVSAAITAITLTVSAPGFGDWTIRNVRLVAGDTLELSAPLENQATLVTLPELEGARPGPALADLQAQLSAQGIDPATQPLPESIRVRVTGWPYCDLNRPYTVEVVNFRDYVRHVLPNEWGAWHIQSLRAGAMAVKMYAWAMIASGGKWPDADVYDSTCDQVYNPNVTYAGANQAVDDTWPWRLSRAASIFPTYYRAYASQCADAGLSGNCLGQWESKAQAESGLAWDQILLGAYTGARLNVFSANFALRFQGASSADRQRVRLPLASPARASNVGAGDFTLEWWLKALPGDNMTWTVTQTITATCGVNDGWLNGSILFDRDVWGAADYGEYGVSLADGRVALGVNNGLAGTTLCGTAQVADGAWHHLAVTRRRSDGWLRIFVDGSLDVEGAAPAGDVSYRAGRAVDPLNGANDPYLFVGGRKVFVDPARLPAFTGWVDEVRLSAGLRYTSTTQAFTPTLRFAPDAATAALYHLDDTVAAGPCAGSIYDAAATASPADGQCLAAAADAPRWVLNDYPGLLSVVRLPAIYQGVSSGSGWAAQPPLAAAQGEISAGQAEGARSSPGPLNLP